MKKFFTWVVASVVGGIPLGAYAAENALVTASGTFGKIIEEFTKSVLGALTTLFATAALAAFFFGIVKFILGLRNGVEKDVTSGKQFMLWGLIALFVMFSVWGIIRYGQTIFGIQNDTNIVIPTILFGTYGSPSNTTPNNNTPYTPPTNNNPLGSSNPCTGKSVGTSCSVGGRAGTCDTNEQGVFACYATPGSGTTPAPGGGNSTCRQYDFFGTCCDQNYQYVDNDGVCQTAFN